MFARSSDTVFALSSGSQRAGVAVIRVSGQAAGAALLALAGLENPEPRQAQLRILRNANGEALDRALALWFPAPASYTGEDMAEFHVHGSRAVIGAVAGALGALPGTRPAEPGEFTWRAFQNGKLDLAQTEGLADLIGAETQAQRRLALRHAGGEFSRICERWRQLLLEIMARFEAEIDFPDEDLPAGLKDEAAAKLATLKSEIGEFLARGEAGEIVREGFHIAIIGAPNAGKSSLLNALAGRDAAIVSARAGTTRDVIVVRLELDGYLVTLADTAGLRESGDEVELEGIARARREAEQADMRIAVVDASSTGTLDPLIGGLVVDGDIVALNKIDLVHSFESTLRTRHNALKISAKTGYGLDELSARLGAEVRRRAGDSAGVMPSRARHRVALQQCLDSLEKIDLEKRGQAELAAEELRLAASALARITGRLGVEDVLDVVFREFCIGK